MQRRLLVSLAAALVAGCGFKLRQAPTFAFKSIYVGAAPTSSLGQELKRDIRSTGTVTVSDTQVAAQVILDVTNEQREKVVVGLNASGQVREFELRIRVHFRRACAGGRS